MDKLLDLMQQSVILQAILTVMVVGVWLYMMVAGRTTPPSLEQIVGLVVGFYFGGKVALAAKKAQGVK